MPLYHRYKDRFGSAGVVIAVIALVVALGGTALAKGLFSKAQEKKIAQIAKRYAGKPGATGPAGNNGTNGTNGKDGAPGPEGKQGVQGEPGIAGTDGEDGACSVAVPTCTLPPGATLTGQWTFRNQGISDWFAISFPLRLDRDPTFEENSSFIIPSGGPSSPQCPGSASDPKAAPGKLCLYVNEEFNWNEVITGHTADLTSGLIGEVNSEDLAEPFRGSGSWAVRACEKPAPEC